MSIDAHEQTLAHLRLIAGWPGYWELRALRRLDDNRMESRGSFFVVAAATGDGLIYDRLEQAVSWADHHAGNGAELFIGMNPRTAEAKSKDAVSVVTACYVDIDLPEGIDQEEALTAVTGEAPLPSLVVNGGHGLHAVYLLREPDQ